MLLFFTAALVVAIHSTPPICAPVASVEAPVLLLEELRLLMRVE